ncbi:MAG: panthothenate synthetase [Gammaproteobacteria bacterium]
MRMLMTATFPNEPFNSLVRAGTIGESIRKILDELKPESVYFVEEHGARSAVLIIDVADQSQIPFFAEPFFLNFNAQCRFRIAMTPEDLEKAGLDTIGQKWK